MFLRSSLSPAPRLLAAASRLRGLSTATADHLPSLAELGALGGDCAAAPAVATFRAWHAGLDAAFRGEDPKPLLRPHLHDKCVFKPPTYWQAWTGGDETMMLLETVGEVFGSTFRYERQWLSPDGNHWALEFKADIADSGKRIDGVDLVTLDEVTGQITELAVLARPPNGVEALKSEMMRRVPPRLAALKARKLLGL